MRTEAISRRRVPGTTRDASSIGFFVEPGRFRTSESLEALVAQLRTARDAGVTTFHLGAGSATVERAVARAFPETDPELLLLAERSSRDGSDRGAAETATPGSESPPGLLHRPLEEANRRLDPHRIHLVDWVGRDGDDARAVDAELALLRSTRSVDAIVRRDSAGGGSDLGSPSLRSGSLSLLDDRLERRWGGSVEDPRFGLFALDPLAGGRLDGRRLAESVGARRPDAGPVRLRELEEEFAPVLELGFLTEGRRRTLAQASIRFVLHRAWVCSALVPLPAPEQLGSILATESTPELTEVELERLARRASPR